MDASFIFLPKMVQAVSPALFIVKAERAIIYDIMVPRAVALTCLKTGENILAEIFERNEASSKKFNYSKQQIVIDAALTFFMPPLPGKYVSKELELVVNFN